MKLAGWGRFPIVEAESVAPRDETDLTERVRRGAAIARGNGRSYGDSAISRQNTVQMRHFDRLIAFDDTTGQVVAEAGVLLGDIIDAFLPLGWFPAVTPGTKFVTLGGMIAADVHGKNHHKDGSFSNFVDWIDLMAGDGTIHRCSRQHDPDRFDWTFGGMGLTGVILRAAFRLRRVETAWIRQTTTPTRNLDEAIDRFEHTIDATYSVAWIDCLARGEALGRSLLMTGEHASLSELDTKKRISPLAAPGKRKKTVPFDFPSWSLNRYSVRAFNEIYFRNGVRGGGERLVDWDSFFYPLDALLGWNRIYGRKGFAQFQCVMPLDTARAGLRQLLERISDARTGSFLAVLKRLGAQNGGLSFPMEGYTLALDFPVNAVTMALLDDLDAITLTHGGRFYLAKDSRMKAGTLRASDVRTAPFTNMRKAHGLHESFKSTQSERLEL